MNTTKTKPTHTPGPWIVDDKHIHCAKGLTLPYGQEPETDVIVEVNTDCHEGGILRGTDKANLRLIASAPDLLAALKEIAERGPLDGYGSVNALRLRLVATQSIARAAIAKAETPATNTNP